MSAKRYAFRIPIGDWSGDGHEQCKWFTATAKYPIETVREAYFTAKILLPDICPEDFCSGYEEYEVAEEIRAEINEQGFELGDSFGSEEMAAFVVWFLNRGYPDLDARLEPNAEMPMLPFYGQDACERHISFIGYGLFE
jgi:hypothetical protein